VFKWGDRGSERDCYDRAATLTAKLASGDWALRKTGPLKKGGVRPSMLPGLSTCNGARNDFARRIRISRFPHCNAPGASLPGGATREAAGFTERIFFVFDDAVEGASPTLGLLPGAFRSEHIYTFGGGNRGAQAIQQEVWRAGPLDERRMSQLETGARGLGGREVKAAVYWGRGRWFNRLALVTPTARTGNTENGQRFAGAECWSVAQATLSASGGTWAKARTLPKGSRVFP